MTRYQPQIPYSQRVLDNANRAERAARAEAEYFREALKLIAAPIPFEGLSDPSFRKMGRLFAKRIQIAQRALLKEPLELPSMAPDAEEQELARGHFEENQKDQADANGP